MVIDVFSIPDCPWCALVEHDLTVLGHTPFVWTIASQSDKDTFKKRHGTTTFPQVFEDDVLIGGYKEVKLWLKKTF